MIAFTGFLLCVLIAMVLFPQTDFGRMCHEQLVERPASGLSRFRMHHLIYAIILIPVMLSGGEFLALLGPEFFAAYAMELAIYIDAVIVSLGLSVWANVRSAASRVRLFLSRPLRMARPRRKRCSTAKRSKPPASNDDDRPGEIALVA